MLVTAFLLAAALTTPLRADGDVRLSKGTEYLEAGGLGLADDVSLGRGAAVVLWDQTAAPSGNGVPVQNVEAALDSFDSMAADDFEVPDGDGWAISGVNFTLSFSGAGPVDTVDLAILADDAGAPGAALWSYSGLGGTLNGADLNVALPTPAILGPGIYWLQGVINMEFDCCGQVFWSNSIDQTLSPSHWSNPGDGFATTCTTYMPVPVCGVGGGFPDFLFQILGVAANADLTLTKTSDAEAVTAHDRLIYTLTAGNLGPNQADNVVVTESLPAGLDFVSTSGCLEDPVGVPTCTLGTLAAGTSAQYTVTVRVDESASGLLTNSAEVTADAFDSDPTTGGASIAVRVGAPVPLLHPVGLATFAALILLAARGRLRG